MKKTFLSLVIVFFYSCSNTDKTFVDSNFNSVQKNNHTVETKLKENLVQHGEIISIDFIDNDNFVVGTKNPSNVIVYNISGDQELVISNVGYGPFEFQQPSIIKSYNGNIYIWCPEQLKLIIYSLDGMPIKEYSSFTSAIRNFVPFGNKIAFYKASGSAENFIEIYDLDSEEKIYQGGEASNEHIVLSLSACMGAISYWDDKILFMNADNLKLTWLSETDLSKERKLEIQDDDFKVEKVEGQATSFINEHRMKAMKYIFENSIVTGMYNINNSLLVKAEVGRFETDFDNNHFDDSKRYNKYFVINHDLELINNFIMERMSFENPCLYSSNDEFLYSLVSIGEGNDYFYQLLKYDFELK
ncbi:hypothetical protein [Algoriphagus sp.]|uniref:hypothetical protein n=1 Tax=Algoriphagus sp. TaxID=1872435 RepID=UPI003F7122CF